MTLEAAIRSYVLKTLNENAWNKAKVARILEIDRRTLYRMITRWKLLEK